MKSLRTYVLFTVFLVLEFHARSATASAIPMWEFLSRDEKMSHLFRVYSQQVAKFCADSSMPDCNKNLLVTGLRSLANMDDNALDKLDPYQRGAKEMIWRAMVNGGRFRIGYAPDSLLATEADPLATSDSDTNGLGEETVAAHDYVRPSSEHTGPYLVGPMVIRVYPDGRPVPEDATRPVPRDEDIEEFKHSRIPSIQEITGQRNAFYEKLPNEKSYSQLKNHRQPQQEVVYLRDNYSTLKKRLQEVVAKRRVRYY